MPDHQINAVIEIARHIRDEASEKLDYAFDQKTGMTEPVVEVSEGESCGCSPTPSGQSCC